jgi:hypothetical protein
MRKQGKSCSVHWSPLHASVRDFAARSELHHRIQNQPPIEVLVPLCQNGNVRFTPVWPHGVGKSPHSSTLRSERCAPDSKLRNQVVGNAGGSDVGLQSRPVDARGCPLLCPPVAVRSQALARYGVPVGCDSVQCRRGPKTDLPGALEGSEQT